MIMAGRALTANNVARAKFIHDATASAKRDPEGFMAHVQQHLEWCQLEAVARDRAGIAPDERAPLPIASLTLGAPRVVEALDEHAPLPWPIRKNS